MKTLALPTKASATLRIVGFKSVTPEQNANFKNDSIIITGEDIEKKHVVLVINQAMSDSFEKGHILFEGNFVDFHYEECKAEQTQFLDQNGDAQFHLIDHLRVTDFFASSDDVITNFMFQNAVKSSFNALKTIMPEVDLGDLAKIATSTAQSNIAEAIRRIEGHRGEHKRVSTERPAKTSRKEVVEKQLADVIERLKTCSPALKPTLEAKKLRLEAELA